MTRVGVTGMGVVSAIGLDLPTHIRAFWSGARGAVEGDTVPVTSFVAADRIEDRLVRKVMRPVAAHLVAAVGEALRAAGIPRGDERRNGACYVGSPGIDLLPELLEAPLRASARGGRFDLGLFGQRGVGVLDPMFILKGLPNAGCCGAAIEEGLMGPAVNLANGPTGALDALLLARIAVATGRVPFAVVGGHDSLRSEPRRVAHARQGGGLLGEGAAVLVLEPIPAARARGAPVLAEVVDVRAAAGPDAASRVRAPFSAPDVVFLDGSSERGGALGSAWCGLGDGLGELGAARGAFSLVHAVYTLHRGRLPEAVASLATPATALVLGREGHRAAAAWLQADDALREG